jgi:hypothetical protein
MPVTLGLCATAVNHREGSEAAAVRFSAASICVAAGLTLRRRQGVGAGQISTAWGPPTAAGVSPQSREIEHEGRTAGPEQIRRSGQIGFPNNPSFTPAIGTRATLREALGSGEHGVVVDTKQGQDLVISDSGRLFMYFVTFGLPAVEPSLRADAPWELAFRRAGKEHVKGEAVVGQILAGKPALRNVRRARKPLAFLRAVADEAAGEISALYEPDRSRCAAGVKDLADRVDDLERDPLVPMGDWPQ